MSEDLLEAKTSLFIGGFTGYCSNQDGVLENCTNTGNISVASTARYIYAGGICARCSAGTITGCINSGTIEATTARAKGDPCMFLRLGGLFSIIDTDEESSLTVSGSSNSGAITSRSNVKQLYAGGIAGQVNASNATLMDNTNSGNITTTKKLRYLYCGGLFGCIEQPLTLSLNGEPHTGIIKIGSVESSTFTSVYCGGIIGKTNAELTISGDAIWRSKITKTTIGTDIAAESFFGGICGCADGGTISISGMKSGGAISVDTLAFSKSAIGGILGCGTRGATISNCTNSSTISAKTSKAVIEEDIYSSHIGGIAGRVSGGATEIKHCTNFARVENRHWNNKMWTSYLGNMVGSIVGSIGYQSDSIFSSVIDDCHNTGIVYAYRGAAGGIAGYISNTIVTNCSSEGNITRSAPGGGVTSIAENCEISSCYVKGDFIGKKGGSAIGYVGGIIGDAVGSSADNCKYMGKLTSDAAAFGGIIGKADAASSAGTTTSCGFGGTVNGTTITEETNLSTYAIGSTTGTRGNFYFWNGVLQ